MRLFALALAVLLGVSLSGCDGEECWLCWGGQPNQGRLTLGLTAVPTDQATVLVLSLSGIAFLDETNAWKRINFDPPQQINLLPGLDQPQGQSTLLLEQTQLDGGRYNAIQLYVDAFPENRTDSFVSFAAPNSSQYPLALSDGLRLNSPFTMPRDGSLSLTIDFDLHRGLRGPFDDRDGTVFFQLSSDMRLAETARSGSISGVVAPTLRNTPFCIQPPGDLFTGYVYVFAGSNITVQEALRNGNLPITSVPVNRSDGSYRVFFLPEGNYTVAFVCEGRDYEPYVRNNNIQLLSFVPARVAAKTTVTADFTRNLNL